MAVKNNRERRNSVKSATQGVAAKVTVTKILAYAIVVLHAKVVNRQYSTSSVCLFYRQQSVLCEITHFVFKLGIQHVSNYAPFNFEKFYSKVKEAR